MSKTAVKKLHWRSKVQDSFVPLLGSSGELGIAVGGGADYGEFPFVTAAPGGGLTVGDIILEIGGTPVLGMTLGDVRGVLNSCPHPVRIKTVSPGSTLCKDLRLYLSKCFTPGSVDSQLQQVIRENLYLRAVPCTTRQPRDGEITGVDYNFVSIEEFFSLEESGALLESGKFKGNYYGTPRPVHISAESPPITYQEHRNLLRNFRTRSKSLSNLEKAAEDGENSEDDSGLSGGSAGLSSHRSPGRPRASSSGGDGGAVENGIIGSRGSARVRAVMPDHWEQAFSDPGESYYIDRNPKRTSWQSPRASSRETVYKNEWFTDQPGELRGFPVHTHLTKGSRGFGFNIVGGSRPREFLQVYSVTASGPSALKTADILVFINDVCVLGVSHKEVVEMLKSVPVGHSVDVEVRRGYPMLYNPDGCPKQPPPRLMDSGEPILPPTTTQPQPLHHQLSRLPTPTPQTQHFNFNGVHGDGSYMEPGVTLDANGNATSFAVRQPPSYRRSSMSNAVSSSPVRSPRHLRSLARLQSLDQTLASQSDSEVVSAIGSHRASVIRNHNNNSLSAPSHPLRYGTSKSSESDLSTCTLSGSRLPLPQSPRRPSSSPGGPRSAHSRLFRPQTTSHLRPPPTPDSPHHRSFNGYHGNASPTASPTSLSSPGAMSVGSGFGSGGELVPVALAQAEGDRGLGFSVTAGGSGGRMTIVKRVWDRKQCNSLQPGDAIVKINGADVQSLSFAQVQTILQEHTKQGEVILLVYRGGIYHSTVSPIRRLPPPLLRPPPPPLGSEDSTVLPEALPVPRTSFSTPPSPAPTRSSLIQSTSFLESIPVTLTMEPKDWINTGLEDDTGGITVPSSGLERQGGERVRPLRGFDVELRRKPGEGFGFVIASQDVENGKAASLLPHRFVTVRRGSPAAKSGQIRPGDRLEAVEGRSVVTLPHRELAQILRRVGNTLRLTIVPRPSTYSSSLSETTEYDPGHRSRKGQRSRPKRDSRYYSVDLDRGPSGFGFSLRGGSEYNMGLYVLGLMEGGPASRSQKMQVSDQLVEINGDSTAGMTHSQAVEQIRRGGHRIHLVLKRGNGYVPDYGREHRITSPSLLRHPKEQGLAAVDSTGRRGRSSRQKRRSRSSDGREKEKGTRRRRRGASEGGGRSRLQSPVSEQGERSREDRDRGRRRKGRREESQSLPRDALRNYDDSDTERGRVRGRRRERERRSRSRGRKSRSGERVRTVEGEEEPEEVQEVPAVEDRVGMAEGEEKPQEEPEEAQEVPAIEERVEDKDEEVEERVNLERGESDENIILPIPSPKQKLPRPKQIWEEESDENWDMALEYRELRKEKELESEHEQEQEQEQEQKRPWDDDRADHKETELNEDEKDDDALSGHIERPLPSAAVIDSMSHRKPFSFLTSTVSVEQLWDDESESGGSQSDGSVSAASISGLSLAAAEAGGRKAAVLPGPWLTPSRQRVAQVTEGNRHPGRQTGQGGGRSAVS
ncbi:membrane-associated guanylate kinase, WW and PDZ domain-containing protein 3 isoform X1 [Lates calcarifer]|uniref:Membrane-associated guanylate kinase, WW and PDZ domain-containing protein 3 isoform X1 n=1 Tax=Lates calcarifer TaxID=8187 RepID=A0AAJ8B7D9_LATCA|nr:membrane-associated guanylate kinase, WW and PDZ domain-containing protein 3 isoform X1 [Lates calcarifer]XP_050927324.1 membrane-associated guanylate kinase, WW and PDZ domain-containing protein 3 isoform X1 [Lates calcarifer]XP_050927325.1 membrane-associated guanylate kinase, WW and PDZ domain-containing protein 3 isoform X1 [Lates calcarifer]